MEHLTAHAGPGTLLFHDWSEARDLWLRLLALGPPEALVVMPDHVHLVAEGVEPVRWRAALTGFALWRNHHRGRAVGRVWSTAPPPRDLPDRQHLERTVRYVLLNPCRGGPCSDPLAWPFSTHRDAVGLAVPAARAAVRHPERFHRYVSADPSVASEGTALPAGGAGWAPAAVIAAASALARLPVARLGRPGLARDLAVGVLRARSGLSGRAVASLLPVSHATASRLPPPDPDAEARLARVLGDPRFPALEDGDLRTLPSWLRYLHQRAEKRLSRPPHV